MPDPLITLSGHTEGPWRWQGEDYRGGWGWQLLVNQHGGGILCGQDSSGGPYRHLRAGMAVAPIYCETGSNRDDDSAPCVHVMEADARIIAAAPDLLAIATELMEIARERGSDEKYLAMLWTDRGIEPPQPIEGESE